MTSRRRWELERALDRVAQSMFLADPDDWDQDPESDLFAILGADDDVGADDDDDDYPILRQNADGSYSFR